MNKRGGFIKNSYISIKFKLVISFILMLIPVLLLGVISQVITTKTIEKEAIVSTQNTVNQMGKNVESIMQSVYELYKQLRTDKEFAEQISIDYESLSPYDCYLVDKKMHELIAKYISVSINIANINFIMGNGRFNSQDLDVMNLRLEDAERLIKSSWVQEIDKKKGQFYVGGRHQSLDNMKKDYQYSFEGYAFYLGALVRDYYTSNQCYLVIDISKDVIRNIFKEVNLGKGSEIHLVNYDGRDIRFNATTKTINTAEYKKFEDPEMLGLLKNKKETSGYIFTKYKESEYLAVWEQLNDRNSILIGLIPKEQLGQASHQIEIIMYVLIICTSLIIIILGVFVLPNNIYRKVELIINKMRQVADGDMEVKEHIKGNDEFYIIDKYFNEMVSKLNILIKENYIKEIEKRQAKLDALQFQINPHFLYNTLASINAMAAVRGDDDITQMTEKLGDMFRYNMSSVNEHVSLADEIKHIENYIHIEKIRFGNKLNIFIDTNGMENCSVIRFILQPIVENAIKHGFKNLKREGFIEVLAYKENDELIISISDDGVGIPKRKVEELNSYFMTNSVESQKDYHSSIGLRNVNSRIKLTYGVEYGINIMSQKGVGTEVILNLPCRYELEGEKHV